MLNLINPMSLLHEHLFMSLHLFCPLFTWSLQRQASRLPQTSPRSVSHHGLGPGHGLWDPIQSASLHRSRARLGAEGANRGARSAAGPESPEESDPPEVGSLESDRSHLKNPS